MCTPTFFLKMPKTGEKRCPFCVQPLDVALKAALKGELEDVVLGLLRTPAQYDAQQLKLATKVMPWIPTMTISEVFLLSVLYWSHEGEGHIEYSIRARCKLCCLWVLQIFFNWTALNVTNLYSQNFWISCSYEDVLISSTCSPSRAWAQMRTLWLRFWPPEPIRRSETSKVPTRRVSRTYLWEINDVIFISVW